MVWERDGVKYGSDHIEQFFEGEDLGTIRAAIMHGDFEMEAVHEIPDNEDEIGWRELVMRETIEPMAIEWTTRLFGHPVTAEAESSCYEVMNADGEFVCWCPESHSRVIR